MTGPNILQRLRKQLAIGFGSADEFVIVSEGGCYTTYIRPSEAKRLQSLLAGPFSELSEDTDGLISVDNIERMLKTTLETPYEHFDDGYFEIRKRAEGLRYDKLLKAAVFAASAARAANLYVELLILTRELPNVTNGLHRGSAEQRGLYMPKQLPDQLRRLREVHLEFVTLHDFLAGETELQKHFLNRRLEKHAGWVMEEMGKLGINSASDPQLLMLLPEED